MFKRIVEGLASAQVTCDSEYRGSRLVTVEVEFPRPYLAEFNTHTRFSRNSASSRAIPVWKRIFTVLDRPYIPNSFGMNKSGMQAGGDLSKTDQENAIKNWLVGRDIAVVQASSLSGGYEEILGAAKKAGRLEEGEHLCTAINEIIDRYGLRHHFFEQGQGAHKQHANRVLEPYSFHTVVVTATHWRNFFGLRASNKAQPEAQDFGIAIAKAMMGSIPRELSTGEWHLPYIRQEDRDEVSDQLILAKASAGKCARTSYLTHDGIRSVDKDVELAEGLQRNGHMSPFQHPARPREKGDQEGSQGNYSPVWTQYRKLLPDEGDFTKLVSREDLLQGCRGDEALLEFILSFPE
ncbi:MAG: hypothetical protein B7X04_00175 [Parcubacteria group bacterium 21-54-25]|nr:MAG: hypothetical protein B7X04_00175 [Parcubacteria group bacterium 21-54-25]HQU07526.1 hypothetical protein [Candidatus Paceibacterota bacterium]